MTSSQRDPAKFNIIKGTSLRWAVVYDGSLTTGLQPFEKYDNEESINHAGDFLTRKAAKQWIEDGCPASDDNMQIIWAINLKAAYAASQVQV